MNKNYIFLTLLMLVLAFGTLLLSNTKQPDQIKPEKLLQEIIQPTRYVNTDQVAKLMIEADPGLILVDVRNVDEFEAYSLPGALNIPIENLMDQNNLENLGIPGTKVVFYSNDDIKADQMWVLTKRLGFEGTYVLKGGLNYWMETIINPVNPGIDASGAEKELYSFRKGAQMYFTGAGTDNNETQKADVQIKRREKTNVAAGGC